MKTQIIQLNKNDDYISVRDKMSWSQTGRILLVWPSGGHILDRRLELNLIKRHASMLGAQLALVTREAEVLFIAQQIGIPVFDSPRRAQEAHWRTDKRKNFNLQKKNNPSNLANLRKLLQPQTHAWLEHPATRIVCFVISVFALFALGFFILPSATLLLNPQVETQSMTLVLTADPSLTAINLSTGSLPTYSQEVVVEGGDSLSATGSVLIPDQTAITELSFTNNSDRKLNIPAGTVVTTIGSDPIRFTTSSKDEVPVEPGKEVVLNARAIEPGTSGNLPPDTLVAIEGELGLDFTVTNPYATHDGTDVSIPTPSMQDLRFLRERLNDILNQAALTKLQSLLPIDDTLIAPSLKILETLEETSAPAVGEPGNQLSLSLRLRFQSQVVSGEVLHSLVTPILNANTNTGYSPIVSTMELTRLTIPTLGEDGKAHWNLRAQRKIQADLPATQAIDLVKGESVPRAIQLLHDSLPIVEQVQITLTPNWWPRLPFLPMRIQVIQSGSQ